MSPALFRSTLLLTACCCTSASAFQAFEGENFDAWAAEGDAFGKAPASGVVAGMNGPFTGQDGKSFAASGHGGDAATGRLVSPEFKISQSYAHFLIAGGKHPGKTSVQLLVGDKVVLEATGNNDLKFRPVSWDLSKWQGQTARFRILDDETGRWGVVAADHFAFSDAKAVAAAKPAAAKPKADTGKAKAPEGPSIELIAAPAIPGNNIPKGTSLKIFASHEKQDVTSPTAIAIDEKGAVYVAETHRFRYGVVDNRQHRYWYFDDIASKTTADRLALHEKWKEKVPLASLTEKSEVIRKLVDEDGDGVGEKMTVYADGFNDVLDGTGAGVFEHLGKVYFACIPKIHLIEDTNNDGVADKRGIVADGFGVHISLSGHDMNGFALGTDGRIYGTIGDRGFSVTTREGKKYDFPDQGAIFRFEPDGSNFEVVHTGLRNPKEIAFDEFGNGISVDNNSDQGDPSRIVYMMDGVDSGWRMRHQALHTFRDDIGLPEKPISPWMTEKMADTRNDAQPAYIVPPVGNLTNGPSGLTYHPGTGFLQSERGRFLISDYKGSAPASLLWSFKVSPQGAGMAYEGAYKFNTGVAVTDAEYGYDGRLYVADFVTGWESHAAGRIYTLTADSEKDSGLTPDVAQLMRGGLEKLPPAELARLFSHPDLRVRLRAHVALAEKTGSTPLLIAATKQENLLVCLHGVWGLGIRARKMADKEAFSTLLSLLTDPQAEIRGQAAHILGEVSGTPAAKLIPLLKDESARVRAFAALSLGRLKSPEALAPVITLLTENADTDLYLRHAGIMALLGSATQEQIVALKAHDSAYIRMAAVVALRRLESPRITEFLADADPKISDEVIRAIHEVPIASARPAINALLDSYTAGKSGRPLTPMIARRLIHSAFRTGGKENAARLISVASGKGIDVKNRVEALRLLLQWPKPFPVDQSLGQWNPLPPRDLAEIAPVLEAGIAPLLASDEEILAPTLRLVEDLKLSKAAFTEESLRRMATTTSLPGPARSTALQLWLEGNPPNAEALLIKLSGDPSDDVAKEALTLLVKRDPSKAIEGATAALKATGASRRQAAWNIIAEIPGDAAAKVIVKGLTNLVSPKPDQGAQIELLEAAAKRPESEVKSALAAYQSSLNPTDPLAAWMPALEGGDPVRGEELFKNHGTSQCFRCHRAGDGGHDAGGEAGPNLAGVGKRHDRLYLLESIMNPAAKVADGFGIVSLTLKNGTSVGGILNAETKDGYDITVGTDAWLVKKSDVESATPPISGMPPMAGLLNVREARDIVAFLASLDKPLKGQPKRPAPKPYKVAK